MSAVNYQSSLKSIVRGIWLGIVDYDQAFDQMTSSVRVNLRNAWADGMKEVGLLWEERSPEEIMEFNRRVMQEFIHIDSFLSFVFARQKADGHKLGEALARIPLWVNRYKDLINTAKLMASQDLKLIWELGGAKDHCRSCTRLAGKVKRNSYWLKHEVQPQNPPNPKLECGGYNCDCSLEITDEPLSKGPLPKLP